MNEETFRELLDENGILRRGALAAPPREAAFTVFSQQRAPMLEVGRLRQQATRFFAAKLGLTVEKRYGGELPAEDATRVVLATNDGTASGTRLVFGRPRDDADLRAAEDVERSGAGASSSGMSLLAQRCPTVWLVAYESDDDRVALTIAAIFASVFLGPILSPSQTELFGVRTARLKLEGRASPYR